MSEFLTFIELDVLDLDLRLITPRKQFYIFSYPTQIRKLASANQNRKLERTVYFSINLNCFFEGFID